MKNIHSTQTFVLVCIAISTGFALGGCGSKSMIETCSDTAKTLPEAAKIGMALGVCLPVGIAEMTVRPFLEMGGGMINQMGTSIYSSLVPMGANPFPVHGNWCGPGTPTPGTDPPVTDELDAACRAHDKCYAKYGYYSCRCDVQLVESIRMSDNIPNNVQAKAWRIAEYFSSSACDGCKKTSNGPFAKGFCTKGSNWKNKCDYDAFVQSDAKWCPL